MPIWEARQLFSDPSTEAVSIPPSHYAQPARFPEVSQHDIQKVWQLLPLEIE